MSSDNMALGLYDAAFAMLPVLASSGERLEILWLRSAHMIGCARDPDSVSIPPSGANPVLGGLDHICKLL